MAEWMGDHGTLVSFHGRGCAGSSMRLCRVMDMLTPTWSPTPSSPAPAAHIFTIGNKGVSRLGYKGTTAIVGPESNPGFGNHVRDFVIPNVPNVK